MSPTSYKRYILVSFTMLRRLMLRLVTILAVLIVGGAFAFGVPLPNVMRANGQATVALSIMTAAIFVRLNRGMPTLDWKTLTIAERRRLTAQVLDLTGEYTFIVGLNATLLVILVVCSVYDDGYWQRFPGWMAQSLSGLLGGLLALAAARMSYVVWRDYDVVSLQKVLIDKAGEREEQEKQAKVAAQALESMRGANLRRFEVAAPQAWPDD